MYGTVHYFAERLQATIMNRLVIDDGLSLKECYTELKHDVTDLTEGKEVKDQYLANLNKAYEKVNELVSGREEEFLLSAESEQNTNVSL